MIDPTPAQSDETRPDFEKLLYDKELMRLASLVGTDAKIPDINLAMYVSKLIDTATRTAVTEALDKVAAGLPEKLTKPDDDCEGKDYALGIMAGKNAMLEAVRAVIAAGGKQS